MSLLLDRLSTSHIDEWNVYDRTYCTIYTLSRNFFGKLWDVLLMHHSWLFSAASENKSYGHVWLAGKMRCRVVWDRNLRNWHFQRMFPEHYTTFYTSLHLDLRQEVCSSQISVWTKHLSPDIVWKKSHMRHYDSLPSQYLVNYMFWKTPKVSIGA